jgi:hypothetical protein
MRYAALELDTGEGPQEGPRREARSESEWPMARQKRQMAQRQPAAQRPEGQSRTRNEERASTEHIEVMCMTGERWDMGYGIGVALGSGTSAGCWLLAAGCCCRNGN